MIKKVVSIFVTAALILNLAVFPVYAEQTEHSSAAYTSEPSGKSADPVIDSDYTAEYFIKDSWGTNQIIEIKITNMSDEDLTGWAVRLEADGRIEDLWGASVYKHEGTTYVLEGAAYDSSIKPGASAVLGYKYISETGAEPENMYVYSLTDKGQSYTVETKKMSGWGDEAVIHLIITNNSDTPVKYWSLSFEADFEISQIWNGKLLYSDGNTYTIGFDNNTQIIQPDSSVTIGMQCKNVSDISVRSEKLTGTVSELNPESLFVSGTYDEEKDSIFLNWNSGRKDGFFTILSSTDGTDFSEIETVRDTDSCSIDVENTELDSIYFKVKQTVKDGQSTESNIIKMVRTENGYDMEMTDTDQDGLSDITEFMYGTDYLNPDTDGDGLTDYEEIYLTGTDPLKADTDDNGISDADEDPDRDGLSNREEISLGTDPASDDTDSDDLKDGDEVNKYGTDPLKYDTDGDGISDGDEVITGLDPLEPATHGVPDNEYTFEQNIPSDSDVFERINTEENPFELSISLKAAGYAENSMIAGESGYSDAIKNNFIVGIAPEFIYDENLKTEEVTYTFQMKEAFIPDEGDFSPYTDEFDGVKRYCVFKYFEDENMLMPIKTEEDEKNNTISAVTDCFGTYCVVDMEKWFVQMGAEPESMAENTPQPVMLSIEPEQDNSNIEITPEEKEKMALEQNANTRLKSAGLPGTQLVKGEYAGYNVMQDGRFSIGTTEGNPALASDNNKKLLYAYDNGSTSYTTLKVNGYANTFSGKNTKESSTAVATENRYSGIDVKQTLDIIENSATGRKDVVQITYTVTNTTSEKQSVGCRIMMDTMLGNNDSAPFRVLGSNVTTETEYTGGNIPQVWQAFDSLQNPGVVAQGTFYKAGMLKPDKVQFVSWGSVYNVPWDYRVTNGRSNGDSAVTVTWNEKALEPGQTREYTTYYGLSEFTSDREPPIALSVSSNNKFEMADNKYSDLGVFTYLENIGNGDASDVEVSIELPEELELVRNKTDYTGTANKKWGIFPAGELKTCNWLLKVKDNYNSDADKEVTLTVKVKYGGMLRSRAIMEKAINKPVLIPGKQFEAITLTGYERITLEKILNDSNKADTDRDGLTDWDEVYTALINEVKEKKYTSITQKELPTFSEMQNYLAGKHNKSLFYVEDGLRTFREKYEFLSMGDWDTKLSNTRVLPVNSDPTRADSDGDGYLDKNESISKRLKYTYPYYDKELYPLHLIYPKAIFKFEKYAVTLKEFSDAEYESGYSLTQEKPLRIGYHENQTDQDYYNHPEYRRLDKKTGIGLKSWYYASQDALYEYCNVIKYLNPEHIFAFYDLRSHHATIEQAKKMLKNTYFNQDKKLDYYAGAFVDASMQNNIDLSYLISRCLTECGAKNAGSCSELCAGQKAAKGTSKGQLVYNMYGIGATDNKQADKNGDIGPLQTGTTRASNEGWTSERLAIIGGAKFISKEYIAVGQYTLYLQKYNVNGYQEKKQIVHQYATAIRMPFIGSKEMEININQCYSKKDTITFVIPVFK